MSRAGRMTFRGYAFATAAVAVVMLVSLTSAGWSLHGRPATFVLLAACVLVGELLPVRIPRGDELSDDLTLSGAFALAVMLLFGPVPGVAVYAGACLVAELVHKSSPVKALFNVAQCVVVLGGAAAVFAAVAGHSTVTSLGGDAVAVVAAVAFFFIADNVVTSVAVALLSGTPVSACLRSNLTVHAWTEASVLALSPIVVAAAREVAWLVPLMIVPMTGILIGGRQAAASWYRALYDDVTGLPNRALFLRRVESRMADSHAHGALGVAVVAVDGLKAVGDALGGASADQLASIIGSRLAGAAGEDSGLARVSPNEFALAAVVTNRQSFTREVSRAVAATLDPPFMLGELSLSMHGFAGVAWHVGGRDGDGARELLARATVAAGEARTLGQVVLEAPREEQRPLDRLILAGQLQHGIERGELVLEYQPKQPLRPGLPDAVEALVRWQHPELGPLSPQAFVPLAEQTGLIAPLTRWVVSAAIRQCRDWLADGLVARVAVNVSARDVVDPELAGYIERELRDSGLPPEMLQLEVTETELIGEPREAGMTLGRLARAGVMCAIDDFGTGYSSLAQLQSLPFDEIKIDRSFVAHLERSAADAVIVQSTIGLARNLGLRVTAEGVETRETLDRLIELGCDYAQGYHVSKPLSAIACRSALIERASATAQSRRFRQLSYASVPDQLRAPDERR